MPTIQILLSSSVLPEKVEPELMYGLFTDVCDSIDKVINVLK